MILIDATYINQSGPLQLLELLFRNISSNKLFFLLDARIKNSDIVLKYENENIVFINSNEFSRLKFYLKNKTKLKKVFCFANIPPPIRLRCEVYTYFHNVILIDDKIRFYFPLRTRLLLKLKFLVMSYRKNYTDKWFTQTTNVQRLLMTTLNITLDKIEVLPFFDDTDEISKNRIKVGFESFFYPAVGIPHKNHIILLNAWEKLYFTENFKHQLHLTIDHESDLGKKITLLQKKGVPIINHGYLKKIDIIELYKKCKYIIHPSLGESFGLVLIEAIQQGCILLAPNLPYVKAVVRPNYFFDLNKPNSLVETIKIALKEDDNLLSKILIKNEISILTKRLLG